ncbi:MAG: ParA family protein, partial [Bryobacteraceae bacterium]
PVIAFFNNKGGVGKTSLVYHLAWMFSDQGTTVLAADLDPQANLTAAFLDEDALEGLFEPVGALGTIYGCVEPLVKGTGDITRPASLAIADNLVLLPGDLRLSSFEEELSSQWPASLSGNERAFRVLSAFWRIIQNEARELESELILVDLWSQPECDQSRGINLG